MKRIVFTVTTDLNHDQRMQRICSSLHASGYDVTIVGRNKKSSKLLKKQLYRQKRINCFFEKSMLFYMEYNIRLFFFLLFVKVDIISAVDLDTVLPAYITHRLRRKEIVFDAHEYFTELPELDPDGTAKKVWNMIANYCLPNIERAYTVNESLAEIFSNKYNVEYGYVRSITSLEGQVTVDGKDNSLELNMPRIILYQGALNIGRGIEIAIRSMAKIDNAVLELAGDGDVKSELVSLVEELRLESKVSFLGNLSPEDLARKTKESYIGLNLLESSSLNYYYSLANKFFDYMHAGIPSVNMRFPEYERINSDFEVSLLLEELSVGAVGIAINTLLNDDQRYQVLQQNTIDAKEVYNWEKEEKKLIRFYSI